MIKINAKFPYRTRHSVDVFVRLMGWFFWIVVMSVNYSHLFGIYRSRFATPRRFYATAGRQAIPSSKSRIARECFPDRWNRLGTDQYVSHTDPSQPWDSSDGYDDYDAAGDDCDSDLWVNDPELGTVLRHKPVDLQFLPGTVCRWDSVNGIYWICSNDRPVAIITVGNSEDFPTYSMFRIYPETVGTSTVYGYGWCVYSGQDWIQCQRWALELI